MLQRYYVTATLKDNGLLPLRYYQKSFFFYFRANKYYEHMKRNEDVFVLSLYHWCSHKIVKLFVR